MQLSTRLAGTLAILIAASFVPANAQTSPAMASGDGETIQSLIAGTTTPSTLQLKDLDASWRRLTLGGPLDAGHWVQVLSSYLGTPNPNIVYTKGQTVTIGGEAYLAAYRPLFTGPGLMELITNASTGQMPDVPKLTPETTLSLSLLNLRSVGSLDDIRPFNLDTEVAESAKSIADIQALISMLEAMKPSTSDHAAPWHPKKKTTPHS